ncbi:MAG: SPOR domain-containing protein [Candidatus Methylopumilus sp.]|nr:SPOR domain-containing protein [Candidatus Methylopumilus sp.]
MGLFSRKDSAAPRKPPGKVRPSVSSEAQAADLRVRARRRLAGAVALVLAAVVVLPMLLDSEPAPVSNKIPIKIPDRNAPFQPNLSDPVAANSSSTPAAPETSSTVAPPAASAPTTTTPPKPEAKPRVDPNAAATKVEASKPPPNPPAAVRTDDGARAVALLEGRPTSESAGPPGAATTPKAPTRGNFVVQAMSLDIAADAQTQKNKLLAAGVGNAFVDGPIDVNGKARYRVRVGPFPSREAAQAAQTRLRTLGYDGAFIATQ